MSAIKYPGEPPKQSIVLNLLDMTANHQRKTIIVVLLIGAWFIFKGADILAHWVDRWLWF
jgi:hypothetical protein